jgi:phospho-N-acetylmuramoyl-pentapeptide-transferase
MLYQFILNFVDTFGFLNVFKYITFRTGLSLFTSLIIVLLIGGPFINFFSNRKIFNPIRDDGPEDHIIKKIGTPTMGGVIILFGLLVSVLCWGDLSNVSVLFCIYIAITFGLLGAFDDYKKIQHANSSGISSKFKILSQIILAILGISFFVYFIDYQEITNLYFPFFKNLIINLGWFFIPFSVFVIVGSSNAVNLTDGLDGLATVPVILVAGCFAFISYMTGNIVFSNYLQIPYIEGTGEVSIFCGAIIGSCLGFLWFNAPPAKIFMGDTGSLALGGSLGAVGIITKHEIVLAITGGLFVLEAVSVMVQVISFKLTGKRIFRMAPIHHHFEKKGWPESTVVIRFWIISIILGNDRFSYFKTKIMTKSKNIFLGKKILIYGLGKSGISSYKFLKNIAKVYLFDDNLKKKINSKSNQRLQNIKEVSKIKFDKIIISPGIDIHSCKLVKILKKNLSKIYTDLDVFYSFYKNKSITITGTNGKSTTAKILHEVLLSQKYDSRLIGNIGNPVLAEKQITKKTVFVIEASSYQLDYSKIFTSKYALILNITPDHLERHKNLKNYINAKFKLLDSQSNKSIALVKKDDPLIRKTLKNKRFKQKIIQVDTLKYNKIFDKVKNQYFLSFGNKENLSFILKISKILKLDNKNLLKT